MPLFYYNKISWNLGHSAWGFIRLMPKLQYEEQLAGHTRLFVVIILLRMGE